MVNEKDIRFREKPFHLPLNWSNLLIIMTNQITFEGNGDDWALTFFGEFPFRLDGKS